jgi:hypothetical protein
MLVQVNDVSPLGHAPPAIRCRYRNRLLDYGLDAGANPLNVLQICQWTWMCTASRYHPNTTGYGVIAQAFRTPCLKGSQRQQLSAALPNVASYVADRSCSCGAPEYRDRQGVAWTAKFLADRVQEKPLFRQGRLTILKQKITPRLPRAGETKIAPLRLVRKTFASFLLSKADP